MDEVLLSFESFARFINTILPLLITLFLFTRRPRSTPTLLLGIYFAFVSICNLGFFITDTILSPIGALGWHLAGLLLFGLSADIQFAYRFPVFTNKREAKIVLWVSLILAGGIYLEYVIQTILYPIVLHKSGYGSSYGSLYVPVYMALAYAWVILIYLRKTFSLEKDEPSILRRLYRPRNKDAKIARNFCGIVLLEFALALAYALYLKGFVRLTTIDLMMGTMILVIYFLYVLLYVNHSFDSISFIYKILGISLVTVLIFLGFAGRLLLNQTEGAYDWRNKATLSLTAELVRKERQSELPSYVEYVVAFNKLKGAPLTLYARRKNFLMSYEEYAREILPALDGEIEVDRHSKVPNPVGRVPVKIGNSLYQHYNVRSGDLLLGIGFNYREYRLYIGKAVKQLIWLTLAGTLAILIFFPLVFYKSMVSPLNALLTGVKEVNSGNLNIKVPIFYKDDIGYLAAFFNRMVLSVRESKQKLQVYADNLERMVRERTRDLRKTLRDLETANKQLLQANQELGQAEVTARRDMNMAIHIQSSYLPKQPPSVPGWELAFMYRPMSGVSGDFYDFYEIDDKLAGVGVFDVSGHGISSGLITMIARGVVIRNFLKYKKQAMGSMMDSINRELILELEPVDNYLTGILLRFKGDRMEYANAGHPDLLVRRSGSKRCSSLRRKQARRGSAMGFAGLTEPYPICETSVQAGDMFLLFTDCYLESTNSRAEAYGIRRIMKSFNGAPEASAQETLDYLMERFDRFTPENRRKDDLTVILLKRRS